jgi:chemotaxis protein MotB
MADDEHDCPACPPPGSPGWMGTFADLMSLLMCFFVLLLSFSEMDAMKFKRLAGSMAQAFGVQAKLEVKNPPKGTSIIAQEFSPGRPEPTPINEIYQHSDDIDQLSLDVECAVEYDVEAGAEDNEAGVQEKVEIAERVEALIQKTKDDAMDLAKGLSEQIAKGEVEIETQGRQIIIRIREKGSFGSGSASLDDNYIPLMQEVRDVLATKEGSISVQGHTDNIPISTERFRSNWELSTSRAVSVAQELLSDSVINPRRLEVSGFADTQPLDTNETSLGRAKNRRVEIVIQQGLDKELEDDLQVLKEEDPEYYESLELEDAPAFDLNSGEIF